MACLSNLIAQETGRVAQDMLPVWERGCAYTREVIEAMPTDKLNFRPEAEVKTFAGHAVHLVQVSFNLSTRFLTESTPTFAPKAPEVYTQEELLVYLNAACSFVKGELTALTDEEAQQIAPGFWGGPAPKSRIVHLMLDHMTHHRSAMIVYLRLNGIKPPRYRGW